MPAKKTKIRIWPINFRYYVLPIDLIPTSEKPLVQTLFAETLSISNDETKQALFKLKAQGSYVISQSIVQSFTEAPPWPTSNYWGWVPPLEQEIAFLKSDFFNDDSLLQGYSYFYTIPGDRTTRIQQGALNAYIKETLQMADQETKEVIETYATAGVYMIRDFVVQKGAFQDLINPKEHKQLLGRRTSFLSLAEASDQLLGPDLGWED